MKNVPIIKYITSFFLTIIIYFVLISFYQPVILSTCTSNGCELINNTLSFSLKLEGIIFCTIFLSLLALIAITKKDTKRYLITIGLLLSVLLLSLLINQLIVNHFTKSGLIPNIANTVTVDYRLFYYTSTLFLFPVFVKQLIAATNFKNQFYKFQLLSHINWDIRILRFIAKLLDSIIVLIFAITFSKIIVIYPDSLWITVLGIYLYFFTIEYSIETSVGKLLFGLKVNNTKNDTLSGFTIFLRTIGRLIPLYSISILFKKDGLHDIISGTEVIKNR